MDIHSDLGRTSFDTRSRYFIAGSVTLPHYMQFSPFMNGQSGSPFNITSGNDDNSDTVFNDRPYLLTSGLAPASGAVTKSITGCGTFTNLAVAGASRTPINYCTGPTEFTFNFRFTKTWGFGEMRNARAGRGGRNGGQGGQGGGFGMPGGGGPPGGGGGGGGGGGTNTGRRYNFTLGMQAQNVFGNKDLSQPNGTLTSPNFGQSTQLAGGQYTTSNAIRRISLQASFSF